MAAKQDLPVCPHAGGVGLCELVDHLHEHFVDPCVVRDAAYVAPEAAGYSTTTKPSSLEQFRFRG